MEISCDFLAAFASAFCVAPFIQIFDQAIVENASKTKSLSKSLQKSFKTLIFKPHQFFRQPAFFLLWGVYGGTYLCVNAVKTMTAEKDKKTQEISKFFFVSVTNLSLNISKDRIFSQMFGKGDARKVPLRSICAFGLRDCMTVFTSFNIAPVLGDAVVGEFGLVGKTVVSMLSPLVVQFVSAPVHLYGLDYYNRPTLSTVERIPLIQTEYLKTAFSRCARIFPAFSILPLINTPLRETLRDRFVV